ncbi:putative ATP-grasp-modified RiPP [Kitasatospora sp. cg17-2]
MPVEAVEPVRATRPFGLTRAVPVVPVRDEILHTLTLCPERQVSITPDHEVFVHAPSMTTQGTGQTTYVTTTDHQTWNDNDTVPTVDQ